MGTEDTVLRFVEEGVRGNVEKRFKFENVAFRLFPAFDSMWSPLSLADSLSSFGGGTGKEDTIEGDREVLRLIDSSSDSILGDATRACS